MVSGRNLVSEGLFQHGVVVFGIGFSLTQPAQLLFGLFLEVLKNIQNLW